jgi:hypothetical protein
MNQRIGSCSLCGGDVYGHVGPWWGTIPPPPPTCGSCGAVARSDDTIEMVRPRQAQTTVTITGVTGGTAGGSFNG